MQELSPDQTEARRAALALGNWDDGTVVSMSREATGWAVGVSLGGIEAVTVHLPPEPQPKLGQTIRVYLGNGNRLVGVDLNDVPLWFDAHWNDPPSVRTAPIAG